jgi:peptidoglycan/LPS O-acetylase OafA/YrhL
MALAKLEQAPTSNQIRSDAQRNAAGASQRFYRPELDALRFGAFACVFLTHAVPSVRSSGSTLGHRSVAVWMQLVGEAGNFGVCLFFVLSAYLITEIMRRESISYGTLSIRRFYLRRILRIWPLYLGVVVAVALIGIAVPALHMSKTQLLAYLLFAGNWYLVLFPGGTNVLSWLWSISVEEQFYIAWPLLERLGGARAILWASLGCLPVAATAIAFTTSFGERLYATVWLNSLVQFEYFAVGALIAIALAGRAPRFRGKTRAALIAIGVCLWCSASAFCLIKDPRANPTMMMMCTGYFLVGLGCICLLLGTLGIASRHVPRSLAYLGRISYGLYVFHELALQATTAIRWKLLAGQHDHGMTGSLLYLADRVCALALTIGCAAISYKFLERPFLRINQRFALVQTRPA